SWDQELETIAQRWANQCINNYDYCRNVERFNVLQLLASKSSPNENKFTLKDMIQQWVDSIINFRENLFSKSVNPRKVAEFYYVILGNATKFGCGQIKFKNPNDFTTHNLICNYGPM
ncbi:PREDICTED: venom allergen 3-like, partial [Wasmannia auropunctata]|uniref:venom allergen 3-like n=1 Tax=Wasmannia auropunctata TaxID=64793 RepID=UPI0005F0507D